MSFAALAAHIRGLSPRAIESLLGRGHVVRRAQHYAADRRVDKLWADGNALRAAVSGSLSAPYLVVFRLQQGTLDVQCSCPYAHGTCWHAGAVLLTLLAEPERLAVLVAEGGARGPAELQGADTPSGLPGAAASPLGAPEAAEGTRLLVDRLLGWPKRRLAETLAEFVESDPVLRARLLEREEHTADLDVRLFRQATFAALRPGQRIGRFDAPRIAADLREIAGSVRRLVGGGQPEPALDLLEEIAARAWARVDDADDRDGALAAFVRDALVDWCRGWEEVAGRDRHRLAREIFGWIVEDQGRVTAGLVLAARATLGTPGLEALAALLRPLAEARRSSLQNAGGEVPTDPLADRIRAALREAAEARGDLEEFLRHCDVDGGSGAELAAAAARLAHEGHHEEALRWADRGEKRARGTARAALQDLRIALLARLERRREAIEAAWLAFAAEPGAAAYRRLLGVAGEVDRPEWRRRALDHAEANSDASAFVEVVLAAGDTERLAQRLLSAPGFVLSADAPLLQRAALLVEPRQPAAAARLLTGVAGRVLADGGSQRHGEARELLERAALAAAAAGDPDWWRAALDRLRAAHAVVRTWFPVHERTGGRADGLTS